ncbi:hypothetical protein FLA_5605 [Filimonas lacunae]|nr:hypothetical protein FLA_5605 [Filimonas lacunae]
MLTVAVIAACSPAEKRFDLPAELEPSALKFSVTQQQGHDNTVYLKSLTPGTIPYWDFDGGTSTLANDTIVLPFSGSYIIKYSVSAPGGFVAGDSVTIKVTSTDLSSITDPQWEYLTGGQNGKTWVLDMSAPVGWYGMDYGKGSGDDWVWHPDYVGNEWVMPNKDYGSMTFDLNNAKNYQRILYDASNVAQTCTGKFDLDLVNMKVKLLGCEMLYGGDYYKNVSNWREAKILAMSASSMVLGVIRDKPNPGDGVCYIGFKFKLKQ